MGIEETAVRKLWRFVAEVEAVDAEKRRILLWIDSSDQVVEIDIPYNMPEWALRKGVCMLISIPKEQQYPQDYSSIKFLEFEELLFGDMTTDEMLDIVEGKVALTEVGDGD
jgi:hypothetical protein